MTTLKRLIASVAACAALASAQLQARTYEWVYRASILPPTEAFANGFTSHGHQWDLLDHVLGTSCIAMDTEERSVWLGTYHDQERAIQVIKKQLHRPPQPNNPSSRGMWIYTIRTDVDFLEVSDLLDQAMAAARQNAGGYAREQVEQIRYLADRYGLSARTQVVTPQHIRPQNIHSAQFYAFDRTGASGPVLRREPPTSNPRYRLPTTYMNNETNDLATIVRPISITAYAEMLPEYPDLCVLCGASNASSSRIRRSDMHERLDCPVPSAAQAFISSDD